MSTFPTGNKSLIYSLVTTPEDIAAFYRKNSDFPGYRDVRENVEHINFQKDSSVRIWYNNLPIPFSFHRHQAFEIIIPVEGYYDIYSQTELFHIEKGDILIIPPYEMHRIEAPREGSRFIYLLDLGDISGSHAFIGLKPLLTSIIQLTSDQHPQIYDEIHEHFADMRNTYFSNSEFYELNIYSDIYKVFSLIGMDYLKKNDAFAGLNQVTRKEYLNRFNNVLSYINEYYSDDLTLEMVAEHSGFSKFHFSRLFKKYTNTTFYDYLILKRIQAAEQLLADADLSITEVALRTGFSSISTFNRTFKRKKNCTPREYRSMCRKND